MLSLLVSILFTINISYGAQPPNIVFIMGESVASSAYFFGQKAPMPLPNLHFLMENGVSFPQTYAAVPVCNPSRATTITGRHGHKHGHYQLNPNTGLYVNGTWNNHEGLDPRQNNTFFNFTKKYADYQFGYFGKIDWSAGLHSVSCMVTSWCNKVNFPYTLSNNSYPEAYGYGWYDLPGDFSSAPGATYNDLDCNIPGENCTKHKKDWESVQATADWILNVTQTTPKKPFLAYWGSHICHPEYGTTKYWLNQVNKSMVVAPKWIDREKMHPEDFQASMKKKFFGSCCNDTYKKDIRAHYYANVAEYDSMIGVLINTLKQANVLDNTWIIATSDHGDMKMEHTQFYKMSPYDSSSRVPSIIYGGKNFKMNRNVIRNDVISSMLDYFPTIMEMAGIDWNKTTENVELDGYSLMPFITNSSSIDHDRSYLKAKIYDNFNFVKDQQRPNYVMSQFHGEEIHLSWFLLRENEWKYIVYGSGLEVNPRLFNLIDDPLEMHDLALNSSYTQKIQSMDKKLKSIINYPMIAENVERYNKNSYVLWQNTFPNQTVFNQTVSSLRWNVSFAYDNEQSFQAINQWLKTPNDTFFWAFE